MICKVRSTIDKYGMLSDVKSVAVGVSGGADSMCLIHILSLLKDEYGIILKVVHVNHNLRGQEALRDENKVREFCKSNNIECLVFSEDIRKISKEKGIGEEECGRIVRYECFKKAQCDAVAVAHSLSDSIETMVFNMIRGTAGKGLCGIPPIREPDIIRPLIDCTRQEIEAYCKENSIEYVTDSTNLTDDYTRNFIRHNIVGAFSRINNSYEKNISSLMDIMAQENDYLTEKADELLKKCYTEKGYDAVMLKNSHPALRRRVIVSLLKGLMNKSVASKHVNLVDEVVLSGEGQVEIAKDLYICVSGGIMNVRTKTNVQSPEGVCLSNNVAFFNNCVFAVEEMSSPENTDNFSDCFDGDKIKGGLVLSGRYPGDEFTLTKRKVTKSLKKLFNEMKIPADERHTVAVLRDDEKVVWVQGIGVNATCVPDEFTKRYCIIKKEG